MIYSNESKRIIRKTLAKLIVPAIVAIFLLIIVNVFVLIPIVEDRLVESKKSSVKDMVLSVESLINSYLQIQKSDSMLDTQAQDFAIYTIENLSYGKSEKNYCWLLDTTGNIISHPFIKLQKESGKVCAIAKEISRDMVELALKYGEGYLAYNYFIGDDTTKTQAKLSFVKYYEPLGWVIGTGYYQKDIDDEIRAVKKELLTILIFLIVFLAIVLVIILYRSIRNTKKMISHDENLSISEFRFQGLVNNITGGIAVFENGKMVYLNPQFCRLFIFDFEQKE